MSHHGYRFIAPISAGGGERDGADENGQATHTAQEDPPNGGSYGRKRKWWVLAAAALALAGGCWWMVRRNAAPAALASNGTMRRVTWDRGLTAHAVISADGKLVAYASDRESGNYLDIYVQEVESGGVVRLTEGSADHDFPAFTPDGSLVAFDVNGSGIYEMPALGGGARLLVAGGKQPRFSPDGRFLLYYEGSPGYRRVPEGGSVYVLSTAGGEPTPLSRGCSYTTDAMWSPDSGRVLFTGYCAGHSGFWLADRTGRSIRHVNVAPELATLPFTACQWLTNPSRLLGYVWSGDASRLIEMSISADGSRISGPVQFLTSGPDVIGGASASSAGRIVYTALESSSSLWRLEVDREGHAKGSPVEIPSGWSASLSPALSGDGRSLAFVAVHAIDRDHTSESEVRIIDLATGKVTPVVRRPYYLDEPVFDPAGENLFLFAHGPEPAIIEVSARGGVAKLLQPVTDPSFITVSGWSSDGSFYIGSFGWPGRVGVAARNRGSQKPLVMLADTERDLWQPRLSVDARWVTFNAVGKEGSRIYVAPFRMENVPIQQWIPLTDGAVWDDKPRLSSDGRILFFLSDRDGFRCIWRLQLKGDMHPDGTPEPVWHFHSSRPSFLAGSLDYTGFAVGPGLLVFNPGEARGNVWVIDQRPWCR